MHNFYREQMFQQKRQIDSTSTSSNQPFLQQENVRFDYD